MLPVGVSLATELEIAPRNEVPLVRSPVFRRSASATPYRLKAGLQTGCHLWMPLWGGAGILGDDSRRGPSLFDFRLAASAASS